MDFEWDEAKAAGNLRKHDVSFEDASRVFDDVLSIDEEDMSAIDEERFNIVGIVDGRCLFVTYTWRGERCRLISARLASPRESRKYYAL
jgi:hypothetical protein